MAGIAEVEVDKATGKVTVVDYAAAVDCGTVINEALARVQAEGGIAQGIGHALYEIVEHDDRGRLRTGNFMSYKLPTRLDIGSIRVAFEPSYEPTGPFGAKSIGEVVINTPLAAVASAVAHATGHQVRSLPITPEKALLGSRRNRRPLARNCSPLFDRIVGCSFRLRPLADSTSRNRGLKTGCSFRLMAIAEAASHSGPQTGALSGAWPAPPDCRVPSWFWRTEPQTGTISPQLIEGWRALACTVVRSPAKGVRALVVRICYHS